MVLSTTVSQQCWTDVHLYATSHGMTVSEVVETLLSLGKSQAPYGDFFDRWYAGKTPEDTFEHLARQKTRGPVSLDA